MKKLFTLLSAAMLTASLACAQQSGDIVFTYASPDAETKALGWGRYVDNDVAILLNNPKYIGYDIIGISVDVPVVSGCEIEPVGKAWLTTELVVDQETYKNVPNVGNPDGVSGEVKNYGDEENPQYRLDITFPEPYKIPEGGIYVGYTLTVTKLASWTKKYPVVVAASSNPEGGLYMHSGYGSSTTPPVAQHKTWQDLAVANQAVSTMRVILRGNSLENGGILMPPENVYIAAGTEGEINAIFHNYGTEPVTSVGYTTIAQYAETQNPEIISNSINFSEPVEPEQSVDVKLPFSAPQTTGDFSLSLKTTMINGVENQYEKNELPFMLYSRSWIPRKRVLLEEYTGTWCGYCPEAYVMLKQLSDSRPDDFVAIAYHVNDHLMTLTSDIRPNGQAGTPSIQVDRVGEITPLAAANQVVDKSLDVLAPADIDINLYWVDNTKKALRAEAVLHFIEDVDQDRYRIAYALVEDKMSDSSWGQRNFFNNASEYTSEYYKGKYWDLFVGQPYEVSGIVYDEVALLFPDCKGIPESVPDVKASEKYTHHTLFNLSDAKCADVSNSSYGKNVIRNSGNLRAVGVLIDTVTGKAVNANTSCYSAEAPIYDTLSSVDTLPADSVSPVITEEYYSLDGLRLAQRPEKGAVIVVKRYADGTVVAAKTLQ